MSAGSSAVGTITISGSVSDYGGAPINAIKVSVYRNTAFVDKAYTDGSGHYDVAVSQGEPVTVWFDTHPTLTNSREWHPSVVASLNAQQSFVLDRRLVRVGETGGDSADVDVLAAYQFATMFIEFDPGSTYSLYPASAAERISRLKLPTDVLRKIHSHVAEFFESRG